MTIPTARTPLAPTDPGVADDVRRARRGAGLAGVLTVLAWFLQPLIVFVLSGGEDRLTYAAMQEASWSGWYEMVTFGLIGTGLLVLVLRTADLARASGQPVGTAGRVGHHLGVLGAVGWYVQGALAAGLYSTASSDLPGLPESDQVSALAIFGVVQVGVLLTGVLASGGWLVVLGTDGVRHGVLGRGLGTVVALLGVLAVVPVFVPFGPPLGTLAVLLAALVLGVALLVGSRRRG